MGARKETAQTTGLLGAALEAQDFGKVECWIWAKTPTPSRDHILHSFGIRIKVGCSAHLQLPRTTEHKSAYVHDAF